MLNNGFTQNIYEYYTGTNRVSYISDIQSNPYNYIWDQSGNMQSDDSKKMQISYDWRYMPEYFLMKEGTSEEASVNIVYDASGNRVLKTEETDGAEKSVAYVDNDIVYEDNNDGSGYQLAYANIIGASGVEGRIDYQDRIEQPAIYYLKDSKGSTREIISEDGVVLRAYIYYAYGTLDELWHSSTDARQKFTGKEFDVEGGMNLYYFGARYFDPEAMVFTSTDPVEEDWNPYNYTGWDPVNYVDPDGRKRSGKHEQKKREMGFKIKIKRNKNGLYILDRPQLDKGPRASNPGKGPEGGNTNKPHSPGGDPGYNPGGKQQHLGNSPNPLGGGYGGVAGHGPGGGGYGHGGVGGFGEGGGGRHGGYGGGHGFGGGRGGYGGGHGGGGVTNSLGSAALSIITSIDVGSAAGMFSGKADKIASNLATGRYFWASNPALSSGLRLSAQGNIYSAISQYRGVASLLGHTGGLLLAISGVMTGYNAGILSSQGQDWHAGVEYGSFVLGATAAVVGGLLIGTSAPVWAAIAVGTATYLVINNASKSYGNYILNQKGLK